MRKRKTILALVLSLTMIIANLTVAFAGESTENEGVKAKFYVLKRGLKEPVEDGTTKYPSSNYFGGFEGTIEKAIAIYNDDEAVLENIISAPSDDLFELEEGEYIKWYVVKKEWQGYHVDGIILKKPVEETTTTEETTTVEEEDIDLDVPFASVVPEEKDQIKTSEEATTVGEVATEKSNVADEEEDIDMSVPLAAPDTGDSSNIGLYLVLLLGAAVGGIAVVVKRKTAEN